MRVQMEELGVSVFGMSMGDVATWAGAIATSAAVWVAILGLRTERARRIAAEVERAAHLKRTQAERVFGWFGGRVEGEDMVDSLVVRNDSQLPIYNAVVSLVLLQGAGARTGEDLSSLDLRWTYQKTVLVVPPGTWRVRVQSGWQGMSRRAGVEVAFRDAQGSAWIRRANGMLEVLAEDPFDHLNVSRPVTDERLERLA
ncbi:hypothetical protein [Arthrobacter sp. FW306-04-A]|uniref:hypothetical protein n=1 Tax=Arthrobacter sp. FW306-04-A TaxID=2879619 RepID=UPI0037C0758A|nr:hypothetical protein LFT43_19905 [Arthrobacter sp. FW306-04-A]